VYRLFYWTDYSTLPLPKKKKLNNEWTPIHKWIFMLSVCLSYWWTQYDFCWGAKLLLCIYAIGPDFDQSQAFKFKC